MLFIDFPSGLTLAFAPLSPLSRPIDFKSCIINRLRSLFVSLRSFPALPSFVFNNLQPLFAKHRGVGGILRQISIRWSDLRAVPIFGAE
jgi:hypothetical protein